MGRRTSPHRLVWEYFYGDCANTKETVYRNCGNLFCIQPDHLLAGDQKTMSNIKRKRGGVTGISETEAREIWNLKNKMRKKEIAKKYDVSLNVVSMVHCKRTHKYLHDE